MSVLLGVNIDHIATLRNVRGTSYPDPVQGAFIAEQAGADTITVHLREDRRHITDRDVFLLKKIIQTNMNLEIAPTEEMISVACKLKPDFCCLVPENRCEITTESGLDLLSNRDRLFVVVSQLKSVGIDVSLFLDIDKEQISIARDLGVSCIELHTGPYVSDHRSVISIPEFEYIKECVEYAISCGLRVNAGHGLNYRNVKLFSGLSLYMLHIGHAIIARSVFYGLFSAVQDMKNVIQSVRS
ncbi:pyridoxine 5'-phosphate synthase [Blochmannia endosymbiont of Polyrhachis (Hedomyrma) turneri]|uniref:pyridoxine 5'-phosphate synthase n=1 Tax=Blochmannia endosymbiont of Polyrhachis (Hedomyrma) turneri TaxID=1505596 RepID=UPI00061A5483|nr:pyridoxine 5'-phosphate synthase [Blochmannia endosymbiont of Polyrhachis (Hedomyrma) turneri]AKC60100.1 pyridoxine 5'-phosphate synthase [Blochmannia endosymbiont of Polyrhachis (Hedomyrma) turneri]